MKIILEKEKPMSWNKYYSGAHWSKRHQEALRVHMLMRAMTAKHPAKYEKPVSITITVFSSTSPIDPDNICAKLYIDGLRHKVLHDDTYKWITAVTTKTRIDKENPRLEIEIREADEVL